ncbi:hypothetical protein BD410DRAFT_767966 [Rickenella mellea]|uniref:Symplekin n=1 Tax=Rickenella mellea TaxID=50990 RepID=A0A4Y7Q900_9AGAM|nr:hypothetical protein BD410DRAFT_767966 [Rickenella mellea]
MAENPLDPLQTLTAALAVPPDSREQAELLAALRENLEAHPAPIPVLCQTLIRTVSNSQDSLLKRWVLELVQFGLCRSTLSIDVRTSLASASLEVLVGLLHDANSVTVRIVVQTFATVYPLLFRFLCTNRQQRQLWDLLIQGKAKILEFVWAPNVSNGVKLAAVKFMQRVILVQTRGVSDPRLQNKNDPNLSFCPADHPFIPVGALEAEGTRLLEGVITILYTSPNPDIVTAVVNSWSGLAKQRPAQTHLIISALASWTPAALSALPASSVKSVEKAVRILLAHLARVPLGAPYAHQIGEALAQQNARMEQAAINERNRKAAAAAEANRKRTISGLSDESGDAKRLKTDHPSAAIVEALASFDFSSLPATLVTDLIVANLQAISGPDLLNAVQTYRQAHGIRDPQASTSTAPADTKSSTPQPVPQSTVKQEPVDPLQMDIDDDEIEYEPDKLNLELSGHVGPMQTGIEGVGGADFDLEDMQFVDFKIPPPKDLQEEERSAIVRASMARMWDGSGDLVPVGGDGTMADSHRPNQGASPNDLWMLLLVRMVTRVAHPDPASNTESERIVPMEEQDEQEPMKVDTVSQMERVRNTICDYIIADFPTRVRLAITWMNEEWFNDRIQQSEDPNWRQNYPTWVHHLVSRYEPLLDAKDRTFARFLLDIPLVPPDVLNLLRDLCIDQERMQVGFTTLREFVSQRPPMRTQAMKILLDLSTHPEKVTRGAAIITLKRWATPDICPMNDMIRNFALQLLRRLQSRPTPDSKPPDSDMNGDASHADEAMEDGEMPQEELVQTEYLPAQIDLPAQKPQVLQHVELIFALCVKVPELLDEIFAAYGQMEVTVQETVQELITPLIRSLGSSHGRLLTLMRTFPPGAETLAFRVLTIFTENGRPSAPLVSLVKSLISERDLDAKFLIPIIAEMDKADIIRHLPRIVSMLNGSAENKALVRNVFAAIVTTPPQTFGSVTSNLPRVRQSELLTPAELMVLLHESEKEIGLKSAIEAIGICFSMTDVFRSEILAVVMQQIVDEPVLPVLFLRTVIQAVTTYKSLVGFVSTTLLSRLITKKIWTNPPLWEGFIRCAKTIAPASFNALLQLPKDQLRELVDKQPNLKAGLREYVLKKAGNKARQAGFLDLFGDDQHVNPVSPQAGESPLPTTPQQIVTPPAVPASPA